MAARRLATPSWAPSGTFSFDGSSSDLALQLYTRYAAGDAVAQLDLSSSSLPDAVSSRLSDAGVAFDALDGFAQRALLWDSGFGVTPGNAVKQIWTLGDRSMAEIALTLDEYQATACTAYNCTQPDGTSANNNDQCAGTDMLTAVKCVVEDFDSADKSLAMWSVGGESSIIPEIELQKHSWTDSSGSIDYTVYAVHTLGTGAEREYGDCPSTESYGYLNIPCYGESDLPGSETKTQPTASDWVTSWIEEYASSSSASSNGGSGSASSSFTDPSTSKGSATSTTTDTSASSGSDNHTGTNVALLGGAIGGGLALLLIGVIIGMCVVARRKRRRDSEHAEIRTLQAIDPADLISPGSKDWSEGQRPTVSTHPRSTIDDSLPRSGPTVAASSSSWPNNDSNGGAGAQERVPYYVPSFGSRPLVSQEDPVVQPPLYQDDVRPDTAVEPPVYLADPVVRPPLFQESDRSSAFVQPPPPYEEALRAVNPTASGEKIFGLGADNALRVLAANPNVAHRRLRLDQLQVERQLPMATLQTDLSVARYNGCQVLVTRLAPSQHVNLKAVEELASEILTRANMAHPNLLQFIGANWSSARDLALVVEYLPLGNLAAYLSNNKAAMTAWTAQKTALAVGIARAIAYLHRQTPPYIHPTIRAKNVLLASHSVAKLAGCGSPETQPRDGTSKSAVDQYWTAPEAMHGGSYSTAADIYAFGVLLSELDTCQPPYQDAISSGGIMLGPAKILELVAEGRLRPSFSAECPSFIRQLGVVCCQQDPTKRPTALQIVQLLEER